MLWICTSCTARYSVGAKRCPQCGENDHADEGEEVPAKLPKRTPDNGKDK